jgi:hypothetical protein
MRIPQRQFLHVAAALAIVASASRKGGHRLLRCGGPADVLLRQSAIVALLAADRRGEDQHFYRHLRGLKFRASRKPACPVFGGRPGSPWLKDTPGNKTAHRCRSTRCGPTFAISALRSCRL